VDISTGPESVPLTQVSRHNSIYTFLSIVITVIIIIIIIIVIIIIITIIYIIIIIIIIITMSTARAGSVSPSSYTNTIFNQSARVLS